MHEPPECEQPEGDGREADAQVDQHGQGDENDHRYGVKEELGVALSECEGGEHQHVGDYQPGEQGGWVRVGMAVLSGDHATSISGFECSSEVVLLCGLLLCSAGKNARIVYESKT